MNAHRFAIVGPWRARTAHVEQDGGKSSKIICQQAVGGDEER